MIALSSNLIVINHRLIYVDYKFLMLSHKIFVTFNMTVRQEPPNQESITLGKKCLLKGEVQCLLSEGIIEPSASP